MDKIHLERQLMKVEAELHRAEACYEEYSQQAMNALKRLRLVKEDVAKWQNAKGNST